MLALVSCNDKYLQDDIIDAFNKHLPHLGVITTDSAEECLEIVKDNSLDLVILEDELADGSGLDVIEQIRDFSDVPIIVLSHIRGGFTVARAFDMGADGYMTTPVRQLEFIARIRAILRRRQIMSIKKGVSIR
jgi:DNA-binding response OmpR family regulator